MDKCDESRVARIFELVQCAERLHKELHVGKPKGIQGRQSSSYLDATLYGMFTFTEVFDFLLLPNFFKYDDRVRNILLQMIVSPLRK